jgi:hypothetical protein
VNRGERKQRVAEIVRMHEDERDNAITALLVARLITRHSVEAATLRIELENTESEELADLLRIEPNLTLRPTGRGGNTILVKLP